MVCEEGSEQFFLELLKCYYSDFWKWDVFKRFKMGIITYNKICVCNDGTVHKLVVIRILGNQIEMEGGGKLVSRSCFLK